MDCHHVTLSFARTNDVDLYVVEGSRTLDVFTGSARMQKCFWASRLHGRLDALSFDQKGTPILWSRTRLPEFCQTPEGDARHNTRDLSEITNDIANAMNLVLSDRGFSRFVKKRIIGSWEAEDSRLEFSADGTYRIIGSVGPVKYSPPREGNWSVGGQMLHLMTKSNDRGVRVALVSVNDLEMRLHGDGGVLFHIYKKV